MGIFDELDKIQEQEGSDSYLQEGDYLLNLQCLREATSDGGHNLFCIDFKVEKVLQSQPGGEIKKPDGEVHEIPASNAEGEDAVLVVNLSKNPKLSKREMVEILETINRCLPKELRYGEQGNGKTFAATVKEDWTGDALKGLLIKCQVAWNKDRIAAGKRPFPVKKWRAVAPDDQVNL